MGEVGLTQRPDAGASMSSIVMFAGSFSGRSERMIFPRLASTSSDARQVMLTEMRTMAFNNCAVRLVNSRTL